ncbi:MAG: cation:dicarboxylase symporter family transporter [Kiloniellales bacterium]|nr:cation:dicarboxylase symporter family transporter [Kiloniellales bacterium]
MILIALLGGVLCGLFLGDYAGALRNVGEVYVGLLQMTVLPYIVFSLIASIGRLSATQGKRLALVSISVLAALWAIGALTVFFISFSLPSRVTGAFFSTHLIEQPEAVDFIRLFVPSNPFHSLANNIAPAVVIFCLLFGIALITVRSKEALLEHFDVILATLIRVNGFVVALSPIGIFAIAATAAGTLSFEEVGRLQAYLLTFGFSAVLLTFVVLPMLIAAFTPFTYRDILGVSKNALVTVFVVQSLFVIIPMLAEGVRELIEKYRKEGVEPEMRPEFVIPLAYPFPHLGKVLTLVFIPFAAWFYGSPMVLADYPAIIGTGLVLSFGKVVTTIPFLLHMQELPADIFQLFLLSSVFAGGLSDLVGAMHLLAFTTLTTCAITGLIRVRKTKLFALMILTAVISSSMIFGTRAILTSGPDGTDSKAEVVLSMHLMQPMAQARILETAAPNPVPLLPGQSRIDRIREQGVIRIGVNAGDLPFAFYNSKGDLVGLDIDMAHRLASDLEVRIDFVPFSASTLAEQLAADHFDLATSALPATTRQSLKHSLSKPVMEYTLALVVPERVKADFSDLETIRSRGAFTLGVGAGNVFAHQILERFPKAKVVELESETEFFEGQRRDLDALLTSAEGGSAWTLIQPFYAVVNPFPRPQRLPAAFPFAGPDPRFERLLNHWIELQQTNGTVQELFDHWILGRGSEARGPRWSVIRDVLHWVD